MVAIAQWSTGTVPRHHMQEYTYCAGYLDDLLLMEQSTQKPTSNAKQNGTIPGKVLNLQKLTLGLTYCLDYLNIINRALVRVLLPQEKCLSSYPGGVSEVAAKSLKSGLHEGAGKDVIAYAQFYSKALQPNCLFVWDQCQKYGTWICHAFDS